MKELTREQVENHCRGLERLGIGGLVASQVWLTTDAALREQVAQVQATLARVEAEPKCAWCNATPGEGYVPCPFHHGPERAYELVGNKEAVRERQRAELLQRQLAQAEQEQDRLRAALSWALEHIRKLYGGFGYRSDRYDQAQQALAIKEAP